jgi:hypothetical protein
LKIWGRFLLAEKLTNGSALVSLWMNSAIAAYPLASVFFDQLIL